MSPLDRACCGCLGFLAAVPLDLLAAVLRPPQCFLPDAATCAVCTERAKAAAADPSVARSPEPVGAGTSNEPMDEPMDVVEEECNRDIDFTVINACAATNEKWKEHGLNSEVAVAFNIEQKTAVILGTWYGGGETLTRVKKTMQYIQYVHQCV